MFCLVTYILTQLISYEFILCCTCYDKLSIKKNVHYKIVSANLDTNIDLLYDLFDVNKELGFDENTISYDSSSSSKNIKKC